MHGQARFASNLTSVKLLLLMHLMSHARSDALGQVSVTHARLRAGPVGDSPVVRVIRTV